MVLLKVLSKPAVAGAVALLVALALWFAALQQIGRVVEREQRLHAWRTAEALRAQIEGQLGKVFSVLYRLGAEVMIDPQITQAELDRLAPSLLRDVPQIRHIALAPDLVIRMVYPLRGNEAALGLDYRAQHDQLPAVQRALALRSVVLAGPVDLVQGGQALVARTPIFELGSQRLWGVAAAAVELDALLAAADAGALREGYRLAIRDREAEGGDVLFGEAALFQQDASRVAIAVPGGRWQAALLPDKGWGLSPLWHVLLWIVAAVTSLMLAALVQLGVAGRQVRRQHADELERRASTDALTGLPNRYQILQHLDRLMEEAQRHGRRFCLVFIDLDNFKDINDTKGHAQGDRLLVRIGGRMRNALGEGRLIGRLGGDEFLVVLPDVESVEAAGAAVQHLLHSLAAVVPGGEAVTASAGVVLYPDHGDSAGVLLQHADRAMYAAKRMGRATWSFFNPELRSEAERQVRISEWMRASIAARHFRVHYQPVHRLADGSVAKCEALLRWSHPEHGMIHPDEFIPVAEQTGMIRQLGLYVLEEVCQDLLALRAEGLTCRISMNRSLAEFASEETVDRWLELLQGYGIDAQSIVFEITESLLARQFPVVEQTVQKVRSSGFALSLDDFGTGYSSIDYLRRLPVDYLKIDKSFVQGAARSEQGSTLLKVLVDLANALGIETVAEGVETVEQLDLLRSARVTYVQGYLFSPAMPLDRLIFYLAEHTLTPA